MYKTIFEHYKINCNEAAKNNYKLLKRNINEYNTHICSGVVCHECAIYINSSRVCLYLELRQDHKYRMMKSQEVYKIIIDELKKIFETEFIQEEMEI